MLFMTICGGVLGHASIMRYQRYERRSSDCMEFFAASSTAPVLVCRPLSRCYVSVSSFIELGRHAWHHYS